MGPVPATRTDEVAQLRSLARKIQRGECVLVLGPGAAVVPDRDPEVPLTVELSEALAREAQVEGASGLNPRDLRHVAQVVYESTRNLTGLQENVAAFYSAYASRTTAFHRRIATLPFRLCVTTTPDDFLHNAFVDVGKRPVRQFYNFRRPPLVESLVEPTVEAPIVYHLYGHVEDPDSLVITETDLIDFLASVVRDEPRLAVRVRSELRKAATTCLFVDLGFRNWYLRALLRALELHGHRDSSVAIEGREFFEDAEQHQTAVYFSASQAIQFRQESLEHFAARLAEAHAAVAGPKAAPAAATPPGAPKVFLSHAHEDRAAVERLGDELRGAGIGVWQDHQNLRLGDRWEQALKEVIRKHVDYVVVVQSPATDRRVESYVGNELSEALHRHRSMLWNFRFVLPVKLGACRDLPGLEELHGVRVDGEEGARAVVAAIAEDWQRRAEHRAPGQRAV
jgi:hypothetical protein